MALLALQQRILRERRDELPLIELLPLLNDGSSETIYTTMLALHNGLIHPNVVLIHSNNPILIGLALRNGGDPNLYVNVAGSGPTHFLHDRKEIDAIILGMLMVKGLDLNAPLRKVNPTVTLHDYLPEIKLTPVEETLVGIYLDRKDLIKTDYDPDIVVSAHSEKLLDDIPPNELTRLAITYYSMDAYRKGGQPDEKMISFMLSAIRRESVSPIIRILYKDMLIHSLKKGLVLTKDILMGVTEEDPEEVTSLQPSYLYYPNKNRQFHELMQRHEIDVNIFHQMNTQQLQDIIFEVGSNFILDGQNDFEMFSNVVPHHIHDDNIHILRDLI